MNVYSLFNLDKILTKKNTGRYILHLSVFFATMLFFLFYSMSLIYQDVAKDYINKIKIINQTEGLDINLMCNVVSCHKVYFEIEDNDNEKYEIFKNDKGFLEHNGFANIKPEMLFDTLTVDYETVIEYKGHLFFINDAKYFTSMYLLILYASFVFFVTFSVTFFIKLVNEYKESVIEKKNFSIETEGKLQRDLTESLNHELNMPIAIVDTLITDLYSYMYPCSKNDNGVCNFKEYEKTSEKCKTCKNGKGSTFNREVDSIAIGHYKDIKLAIERITNVLSLISGAKHIKYSNGTVSLYDITKNIVDSNNSFKVNKVTSEYNNMGLLDHYATGEGLSNGDLLNALHVMIMNSLEAKATHIKFDAEKLTNTMLNLYVEDNGRGVRDSNDRVISTTDIFNYGYSTKDHNGNTIRENKNLCQKIKFRFKYTFKKEQSPRGVGLSINKGIIEKAGGSMVLHKTTSKGTIFKLTIPVKVRKNAV